jgi:hypothetical protein
MPTFGNWAQSRWETFYNRRYNRTDHIITRTDINGIDDTCWPLAFRKQYSGHRVWLECRFIDIDNSSIDCITKFLALATAAIQVPDDVRRALMRLSKTAIVHAMGKELGDDLTDQVEEYYRSNERSKNENA